MEKKEKDRKLLPHLHTPLYQWQRDFVDSTNKVNLCTAANQCGKSVWMMVKNILWATETEKWKDLWPEAVKLERPITQFWYFYEDQKMLKREVEQKWIKEWLPRGEYAKKGKYAWKLYYAQTVPEKLEFLESGVTIYFFTYGQDVSSFQASTVYMLTVDEEMPWNMRGELAARLVSTRGYFNSGFTATKGQDEWRRAMEEKGPYELFPKAFKKQISLFECQTREDGSDGLYDEKKIEEALAQYATQNEILKRVYGKFVKDSGLVFPAFDRASNVIHKSNQKRLPHNWRIYVGIDIGSGGDKGHPSSICFIKVNPGNTRGYIYKMWRGDGIQTTASDILKKYREMRGKEEITACYYDYASAEFGIIASRAGEAVIKADKSREEGNQIINTLFRNEMLKIYEDEESIKLINELNSLDVDTKKSKAKDDAIDAMRYCVMGIPWDFSCINAPIIKKIDKTDLILDPREKFRQKQLAGVNPETSQEVDEQLDIMSGELSEWDDYANDF